MDIIDYEKNVEKDYHQFNNITKLKITYDKPFYIDDECTKNIFTENNKYFHNSFLVHTDEPFSVLLKNFDKIDMIKVIHLAIFTNYYLSPDDINDKETTLLLTASLVWFLNTESIRIIKTFKHGNWNKYWFFYNNLSPISKSRLHRNELNFENNIYSIDNIEFNLEKINFYGMEIYHNVNVTSYNKFIKKIEKKYVQDRSNYDIKICDTVTNKNVTRNSKIILFADPDDNNYYYLCLY